MSILNNLKNIGSDTINKLKDVANLQTCKVCSKTINTMKDDDAFYSNHLAGWYHNTCHDSLVSCSVCNRKAHHLEAGICSSCLNNTSVRSYSYKPDTLFHRVNPKKKMPLQAYSSNSRHGLPIMHFGVEIEVDHHVTEEEYNSSIILDGNNFASLVNIIGSALRNCNLFYCKTDSSLSDDGIEVVSHPFSWNFWKTYGQDIYDTLFNTLLSSGYSSAESSEGGMHIHISKNAISSSQLLKLLWFVYESPKFIKLIAQRTSSYADIDYPSLVGWSLDTFKKKLSALTRIAKRKYSSEQSRYTAMNFANDQTIEFRIFNGTLNIMTLSKNIEFLHSLISYCSQTPINTIVNKKKEETRVDNYLQFLANNQSKYMNLCLFLNSEMDLSSQKKNKYFSEARTRLGRKMVIDSVFNNGRTTNQFKLDRKGVMV